jgi:hypothetical protein
MKNCARRAQKDVAELVLKVEVQHRQGSDRPGVLVTRNPRPMKPSIGRRTAAPARASNAPRLLDGLQLADALREARVVDAGTQDFVALLEGMTP